MILNCMLGTGFGGLEKLFLDEIEMLPLAGLAARGLVRRESALAHYARDRGLAFDEMMALSDWDPLSIAGARRIVRQRSPQLVMCVGRKAHRLLGRAIGARIPIVTMVQKRRFDHDFPYAGVLVAAEHRRRTLVEDGVPAQDIIVVPNAVRLPLHPKEDYRGHAPAKIVALGRLPHEDPIRGPRPSDRAAVAAAIERVGLGHLLGRDARELSLGERQLVLLALAVA